MGGGFWQSPEIQGGVVPFGAALLVCLAIRFARGETGSRFAVLSVPLGFALAYVLLEPVVWPAVSSKQKVIYLAVLALLAGGIAAAWNARGAVALIGAGVFAAISLAWLSFRSLSAGPSASAMITLAILLAVSVVLVWRLPATEAPARSDGPDTAGRIRAAAILLILSFATGLISLAGAFIGMAQLAIAMGAVLGAFLLVSYVGYVRSGVALPFGALGALGAGGALLACIYVMVLFAGAVSKTALAILLLVLVLDPIARKIRISDGLRARIAEPVIYGAVIAVPAVAAVIYAYVTAESSSGY